VDGDLDRTVKTGGATVPLASIFSTSPDSRAPRVPLAWVPTIPQSPTGHTMAKAQDAKKETKKKPEKTLKEKRVEKAAKKSAKG
jgi:hypothetical protein